jgi:hypothetical protein
MKKTGEIAEAINRNSQDIKAEVLIADFMENGLNPEDFVVIPAGTFRRRFSTDLKKAEVLRLNSNQQLLTVHVNRDGMYDSLPEGLFHSAPEKPLRGSDEMSLESKKLRREEKESRAFFVPFENEIFLQRTSLEMEERKILNRFSETLFDEIYPEFWNFDKTLESGFTSRLVQLLHFSHRIAGNPSLTAKSLEWIIGEKVKAKIIHSPKGKKEAGSEKGMYLPLGSARLGMDFICGSSFHDLLPVMEFTIGPLKNIRISDFLEKGSASRFLNCFYGYFIPAGVDVKTTVLVDREKQCFVLCDRQNAPILGYDTAI